MSFILSLSTYKINLQYAFPKQMALLTSKCLVDTPLAMTKKFFIFPVDSQQEFGIVLVKLRK